MSLLDQSSVTGGGLDPYNATTCGDGKIWKLQLSCFITLNDPGFPVGGNDPIEGAPTSDMDTFCKNVCENKRIGSHLRGEGDAPMAVLGAATDSDLKRPKNILS